MKVLEDSQFFLAYDDYLTLYKITDNLQMVLLLGSKTYLEAHQIDVCDEIILLNDPFRSLAVF
jgi:hypothetical protein